MQREMWTCLLGFEWVTVHDGYLQTFWTWEMADYRYLNYTSVHIISAFLNITLATDQSGLCQARSMRLQILGIEIWSKIQTAPV